MNVSFARFAAIGFVVAALTAGRAEATPVNLAPTYGSAYASSETYGAASLAIDGNTDTNYGAGGVIFQSDLDQNPYWVVDLGSDFALTSLTIYQRTDEAPRMLNNFSVSVFNMLGDVAYTNTFAPNTGDTVSTPFSVDFGSVIQGKAIQIILNNPSRDYLALAEVQVFGEVPEPASLALLSVGLVAVAGLRRRTGGLARTA